MVYPEGEISRNQFSGSNNNLEPHVLHQTLDLHRYGSGHNSGQESGQLLGGDSQSSPAASEPSWFPKFDIPFFNKEQEFKDSVRDDNTVYNMDGMPACNDSRYYPGPLPPGKNHHIHDGQADKIGLYLEELMREGKYDAVQTALKALSEHYAPESMAAIGKAFETFNKSDHISGTMANLPDVEVETDGSYGLKNVKLKHFHGQKHSGNVVDQMFDQFTVFDG